MKREKIIEIESTGVPLMMDHIDTDQIIPARFLKAIDRNGFGKNLFYDLRYKSNDLNKEFVLNNPLYTGNILISGNNFGCGSSREHAAWALYDYGFRVIISPGFADIFKNNALNNGMLPIEIAKYDWNELIDHCSSNPNEKFKVNLPEQKLTFNGTVLDFEIDPFKKQCLMQGYDNIDYLINQKEEIIEFENLINK